MRHRALLNVGPIQARGHHVHRLTAILHTYLQREIQKVAFQFVKDNWNIGPAQPIRALTVGVSKLVSLEDEVEQISLFDTENEKRSRQDKLEQVVDDLRKKTWAGCDSEAIA